MPPDLANVPGGVFRHIFLPGPLSFRKGPFFHAGRAARPPFSPELPHPFPAGGRDYAPCTGQKSAPVS